MLTLAMSRWVRLETFSKLNSRTEAVSPRGISIRSMISPGARSTSNVARVAPGARSYKRLDDSKLKLQAIAWSKDAAQRIAVISGHIVREGESVEGFFVNQIRPEDVVVNDGTQSWQLEFGLK